MVNQIIHGDCLDVMKDIEDKSIDLILTDPPYGIKRFEKPAGKTRFSMSKEMQTEGLKWDKKPIKKYFDEIFRISKYQIIWGMNNFSLPETEYFIVWDKKQTVENFASAELAWTNIKKPAKVFRYSIHEFNKKNKYHPTQKPIKLFTWILKKYSKENDLILDPFAGSGTTAIACYETNRRFICIEKEKKYVDIAKKRLADKKDCYSLLEQ